MVRKVNNDDHYAKTLHKFARQYVIDVRTLASFISTGNKHEISVGEPGFSLSVLPHGSRVLVGCNQTHHILDHDFSTISLVPTVILLNEIIERHDGSWYCRKTIASLKITATDPSSALRNAKEIANALTEKYRTKENVLPVLVSYTDGGAEHMIAFPRVKGAMIALQKY